MGLPQGIDATKLVPDGPPEAPRSGHDQIVDIEEVMRKSSCVDRTFYIGEDRSFKLDSRNFRGGTGFAY